MFQWRWHRDVAQEPLLETRRGRSRIAVCRRRSAHPASRTKSTCVTPMSAAPGILLFFDHFSFLFHRIISVLVACPHCLTDPKEAGGCGQAGAHGDTRNRYPRVTWGADGCQCHRSIPASALVFHGWTSAFCDLSVADAASNFLKTSASRHRSKKDAVSVRSVPLAFLG